MANGRLAEYCLFLLLSHLSQKYDELLANSFECAAAYSAEALGAHK